MKSIKVSNNAADIPAIISSAGTSTSALIAAVSTQKEKELAAEKEAAASQDSLTMLVREKDLLEAELAIRVAKEALDQLDN